MFSSIEYQKFAVHLLNTTSPSKPTSVDQAKRPVKALYEKYTAWVGQAALHFKNRHLDLINDKSSLTKLFEEIEDAKRHPAVTTQVTDKVIKAKTVADLAAEELRDQRDLDMFVYVQTPKDGWTNGTNDSAHTRYVAHRSGLSPIQLGEATAQNRVHIEQ